MDEGRQALENLRAQVQKAELEALLCGEADANDTFLELHAGAGGTEAQDILLRMYTRWAEKHNYKVELLEQSDGEEAGIKSAVIKISGHNAYGWLKTESGVHRLVRISPFDANARRHTSFASAWVYPVIDDTTSTPRIAKSTLTERRGRADSTSTKRNRPSASRICRPASSFRAKPSVRNSKTGTPRGGCCAPVCTNWN